MKKIVLIGAVVAVAWLNSPAFAAGDAAAGQQKSATCTACRNTR